MTCGLAAAGLPAPVPCFICTQTRAVVRVLRNPTSACQCRAQVVQPRDATLRGICARGVRGWQSLQLLRSCGGRREKCTVAALPEGNEGPARSASAAPYIASDACYEEATAAAAAAAADGADGGGTHRADRRVCVSGLSAAALWARWRRIVGERHARALGRCRWRCPLALVHSYPPRPRFLMAAVVGRAESGQAGDAGVQRLPAAGARGDKLLLARHSAEPRTAGQGPPRAVCRGDPEEVRADVTLLACSRGGATHARTRRPSLPHSLVQHDRKDGDQQGGDVEPDQAGREGRQAAGLPDALGGALRRDPADVRAPQRGGRPDGADGGWRPHRHRGHQRLRRPHGGRVRRQGPGGAGNDRRRRGRLEDHCHPGDGPAGGGAAR